MNINFPRMFSKKKFALKICYLNYKLLYDSLYQNCCTIIFIKSGSARLFQTHIEGNAVTYPTIHAIRCIGVSSWHDHRHRCRVIREYARDAQRGKAEHNIETEKRQYKGESGHRSVNPRPSNPFF